MSASSGTEAEARPRRSLRSRATGWTRTDLRAGLAVLMISVIAGLPTGALYYLIAPRVLYATSPDPSGKGVDLYQVFTEGKTSIAQDGYFAVIGACTGLVLALVVHIVFRRTHLGAVVGLAVGGVLGSLVMWGFAIWLGSESISSVLRTVKPGADIYAPLQSDGLGQPVPPLAKGVLLLWPLVAALVGLVIAAGLTASYDPGRADPTDGSGPFTSVEGTPAAGSRSDEVDGGERRQGGDDRGLPAEQSKTET